MALLHPTLHTVPCWRPCLRRSDVSEWFPAGQDTSPTPPGFLPLSWHSSRLKEKNFGTTETQIRRLNEKVTTSLLSLCGRISRGNNFIHPFCQSWRHRVRYVYDGWDFILKRYFTCRIYPGQMTELSVKPRNQRWSPGPETFQFVKSLHRWRRGKSVVAFTT